MRILAIAAYYKPAFSFGGPVRSVSALCEGLVREGAIVHVLTTDAASERDSLNVQDGVPIALEGVQISYFARKWVGSPVPLYFYSPSLKRACDQQVRNYDLIYFSATWTYPLFAGASAAMAERVPYVVSPRGSFMTWSMKIKGLKKRVYLECIERNILDRSAGIHCTSVLEQEQLAQWRFKSSSFVVPNPIDLARFAQLPVRGKFRAKLGIDGGASLTVFVGRLHAEKRLELTVRAFAEVVRSVQNAHLAIVGPDYGCRKSVVELTAHLGLRQRVHFVDMVTGEDLLEVYADGDLLVLLSVRENFGIVAAEAMAAGMPVLLSERVGLASEVRKGGAGFVVGDRLSEISATWATALGDTGAGTAGKRLASECFSERAVAKRMLEVFELAAHNRNGVRN